MNSESILYTYLTTLYHNLCISVICVTTSQLNLTDLEIRCISCTLRTMMRLVSHYSVQIQFLIIKVRQILKYTGVFQFHDFLFISAVAYK